MSGRGDDWQEAEAAARTALAACATTGALAEASFTRIPGSVSNYAWHAQAGTISRFVRLARSGSESLGADLAAEARILHLVAAAGLAPAVVRCDPAVRLLVTEWVPTVVPQGPGIADVVVDAIGVALARLHALDLPTGLRVVDFRRQAEGLAAALPTGDVPEQFASTARAACAQLERGASVALCHNDVHAQNLLCGLDGRLWLVDWEYAGLGDPVYDLASCASQYDLDEGGVGRLGAAYARAGGRCDASRIEPARWLFDYVQWLWYRGLLQSPTGGPDLAEARRRATRIESGLAERASRVLRCNNG